MTLPPPSSTRPHTLFPHTPLFRSAGQQITLGTVAQVSLTEGPPMLRSENGRLSGWVYVDVRGRDLASTVRELQQRVAEQVQLDAGMTVSYRSEEHTSELQSLMRISYAVFCLKKKTS